MQTSVVCAMCDNSGIFFSIKSMVCGLFLKRLLSSTHVCKCKKGSDWFKKIGDRSGLRLKCSVIGQ